MSKYHINPQTGEIRVCKATIQCPYGGVELHFDTESDARKAYELKMAKLTLPELISRSTEKSEWRSKDWEKERKPLVENYINKLVSSHPSFKRKRITIKWVEKVNDKFDTMGYRGSDKFFKNSSTLYLSEQAELLEETSVLRLAYHEAAHAIESRNKEDHGPKWQAAAETVLSGTDLEGLKLEQVSFDEYTPEEKVRRLRYRIMNEPKHAWIGACGNNHYVSSESLSTMETGYCRRCGAQIEQRWSREQNEEAIELLLVEELRRRGFTNEGK